MIGIRIIMQLLQRVTILKYFKVLGQLSRNLTFQLFDVVIAIFVLKINDNSTVIWDLKIGK